MGRKPGNNYIDKEELYNELVKSNKRGELTPRAIELFECLIERVLRLQFYSNPMDREDCKSHAWLRIIQYWNRFDYENKTDAFSYFTSVITSAAAQQWNVLHNVKACYNKERFEIIPLSAFSE